jgi:hypothetical protein
MPHVLDADGAADITLDDTNAQVVQASAGEPAHPSWLILRGKGTAVDVTIESGGVLTDDATAESAGDRFWTVEVPAKGSVWEWIGRREVAVSGSAATAISIDTVP